MCHYQEILGVDDYAIESKSAKKQSKSALHLSKSAKKQSEFYPTSQMPILRSLKLMKLVTTFSSSNERFLSTLGRVKEYL